ncbi:MAG: HAD family hydrolase [Kofleriaceae bacterium]
MVRPVLFFDLDDTLFDRTAALTRWVARHVGDLAPEQLERVIELDDRGRRNRLLFAAGLIEEHGLARSVTELAAAFPAELAAQVEREPGTRSALKRLAVPFRLAIVSNGGAAQRVKLARAGIADLIDHVIISGELGIAKPAPGIFEHALTWAACSPESCIFVGDDPINDIAAASAFGMTTVWRVRGTYPERIVHPTHRVQSITELADMLLGVPSEITAEISKVIQ